MYRVFDSKKNKFLRDDFYLLPNNDLCIGGKTILGHRKLSLAPDHRYTYQMSTGLKDKNGFEIFEGDICESDNGLIGVISYAEEKASYLFFDYANKKYYPLDTKICGEYMEIVGNTLENENLLVDYKQKTEELT